MDGALLGLLSASVLRGMTIGIEEHHANASE
jgi:hypothetical protein